MNTSTYPNGICEYYIEFYQIECAIYALNSSFGNLNYLQGIIFCRNYGKCCVKPFMRHMAHVYCALLTNMENKLTQFYFFRIFLFISSFTNIYNIGVSQYTNTLQYYALCIKCYITIASTQLTSSTQTVSGNSSS